MFIENECGLDREEIRQALKIDPGSMKKVLLIPPDITRANSGAGVITSLYYETYTAAGVHVDILPALGTHAPMTREEQLEMYGDIPQERFLVHNWRDGVTSLGEIPKDIAGEAISVEVSNYLLDGYDLILSIGQVVPHEVVGMANYTKNIVVGCGGKSFISASHMLGARHGIEETMGYVDTPVRRLFDYAEKHFLSKLPLQYVLTVTVTNKGKTDIIGLYSGADGRESFLRASALSQKMNITTVERPIDTCVVMLDAKEFHSTWIGNKAVYRSRRAMADGGRLIVLAPGVKGFGEDAENDRIIRKYGYTGRDNILKLVEVEKELQENLSAAAHLIHGSSEGRFEVIYATPLLSKEEVEGVGYQYMNYDEALALYGSLSKPGFNEDVYFITNPAVGLWKFDKKGI